MASSLALHIICFEAGSSTEPRLAGSAGLAASQVLRAFCLCISSSGMGGVSLYPGLYAGSGVLNSGPHTFMERTLQAEASR